MGQGDRGPLQRRDLRQGPGPGPGLVSLFMAAAAGFGVAAVMASRGHQTRAALLVGFVVVLTGARVASHGRVDVVLGRAAATVAHGIGTALLGVVFALALVPAWLIRTGLAPVRRRTRPAEGDQGWRAVSPEVDGSGAWSFVLPRPLGRFGWPGAVASGAISLVGWVVIVLAIDLVIGSVWLDHVHHGTGLTPMAQGTVAHRRVVDLRRRPASHSPDIDAPAMAAYPWRFEYYRELGGGPSYYLPYELNEPVDAVGTYLNETDGVRRSYQPHLASGQHAPEVVFYGGSTLWGQGSRDLHTIPSEVARLAEADGLPLVAVNRAQRGWTSWQEFHAFEQRSARGDRPDLAVFYDGVNEVATEPWMFGNQPVEYSQQAVIDRFAQSQGDTGTGSWHSVIGPVVDEWRTRSIGTRAITRALQVVQADPTAPPAKTTPVSVDEAGKTVASIYRRAVALSRMVGEQHRIPAMFFWQPQQNRDGIYQQATDRLDPQVIDLSRSLDGRDDVYFPDGWHTNEAGTKRVAAAMWRSLRPRIQAWYRAHGR